MVLTHNFVFSKSEKSRGIVVKAYQEMIYIYHLLVALRYSWMRGHV